MKNRDRGPFVVQKADRCTAYIVVHPDEFALNLGHQVRSIKDYQNELAARIQKLINQKTTVIILNLTSGLNYFPEFLIGLEDQVVIIPSLDDDVTESQVDRLKDYLSGQQRISHLVFTGGWKNACLKHTINHTISDTDRVRFIDRTKTPFRAKLRHRRREHPILVEIDQAFVF